MVGPARVAGADCRIVGLLPVNQEVANRPGQHNKKYHTNRDKIFIKIVGHKPSVNQLPPPLQLAGFSNTRCWKCP